MLISTAFNVLKPERNIQAERFRVQGYHTNALDLRLEVGGGKVKDKHLGIYKP
jgi:hypothetical protein